jgi:hypothetical protein
VSTKDEDRISYLAGEPVESLSAEERAALDDLRDLLAAPSAWTEPSADLEDQVVATISAQAGVSPATAGTRQRVFRLRPPSR